MSRGWVPGSMEKHREWMMLRPRYEAMSGPARSRFTPSMPCVR